jgi:hypothetical protein
MKLRIYDLKDMKIYLDENKLQGNNYNKKYFNLFA